jgi:MOSC domain-containing protein YiiM
MGHVEHIHVARAKGAPMEPVDEIEVVKGIGVIGDRHALAPGEWDESHLGEELTLVASEELENLARDHGIHLEPGETRRTITTRGIALDSLVGRRFRVGDVVVEGVELCEPCSHLQGLLGKPILGPLVHRAGIRVLLVEDGKIRVGDEIALLTSDEPFGAGDSRRLTSARRNQAEG